LQLIALLRGPTAWNARRLAEHFGTSRRNIHRDMAVLELAGVPFYFDADYGDFGGYRIRSEWFFPKDIGLTNEECLDLAVLTKAAETQIVPLLDRVSEVRDKLIGTLPAKQQELIIEASGLFDVLALHMADHSHCRRIMTTMQTALLKKRQVMGTYRSPYKKRAERVQLQPRRVFLAGQAWYLAACCHGSTETRLYRLARFKELKMLDVPIDVSSKFSLREMLGNAWTVFKGEREWHVEILFDREAAELIAETRWHHTQELVHRKDGSLLFRCTVSGLDEIKWWVLGWGPQARVRRPKELAESIHDLCAKTLIRYRSKEMEELP
jgi:predicted DNA-binding transcriptional regulator YafY